jgi:hypothetical protein
MIRPSRVAWIVLTVGVSIYPWTSTAAQTVVYVDKSATGPTHDGSSWCSAYLYLQDALGVAQQGDEIRLADGTYVPDTSGLEDPREATFHLLNGVTIAGGYAGCGAVDPDERDVVAYETILSGDRHGNDDPNGPAGPGGTCCNYQTTPGCDDATCEALVCAELPSCCNSEWGNDCVGFARWRCCELCSDNVTLCDNSYHVATGSDTDGTAVLDGLVVTGGNANADESPHRYGGGMLVDDGSPTLIDCTFRENSGRSSDGMRIQGDSSPTLVGCTFLQNNGTGLDSDARGFVTLHNCAFIDNAGTGFRNDSQAELISCSFVGNRRGMYNSGAPILINCLFSGNERTSDGAGMYNWGSLASPTLINCTFLQNSSAGAGGGMYLYRADATIINSVFWGNTDPSGATEFAQIRLGYRSSLTINNSCVQGWSGALGGGGNLGDDPFLVDPDGDDDLPGTADDNARLAAGSPCIDAGDNAVVTVDTDLDGNPRVVDGIVDIGAYEGPKQAFVITPRSVDVPEGGQADFTVTLEATRILPSIPEPRWTSIRATSRCPRRSALPRRKMLTPPMVRQLSR